MKPFCIAFIAIISFFNEVKTFAQFSDTWQPGIGGFSGYHFLDVKPLNSALELDKKLAYRGAFLTTGITLSLHKKKAGIYLDGSFGKNDKHNDSVYTGMTQRSAILSYGRTILKNNDFWVAPSVGLGVNWFSIQYQKQDPQNTDFQNLAQENSNSFHVKTNILPAADFQLRVAINMDNYFEAVFFNAGCHFALTSYQWQTQNGRKVEGVPFKGRQIPYVRFSLLL